MGMNRPSYGSHRAAIRPLSHGAIVAHGSDRTGFHHPSPEGGIFFGFPPPNPVPGGPGADRGRNFGWEHRRFFISCPRQLNPDL